MAQTQLIFDQSHYQRLIDARGDLIRRLVSELKTPLGIKTALDAGCGVGFFAQVLEECGLAVRAFDGRKENVEEARRRYQQILYRAGFSAVYRVAKLPDHDDFRDTPEQIRRRTVLLASTVPISLAGLVP